MNYGHALQAGLFLPVSASPEEAIDLARHADSLGYDVVITQDGSEATNSPDPWTLQTWIAGKTERIQIAVPVSGERLRLPAVLARSAISLDLLSTGRSNLIFGLGEESADALDAAITIIREMMDVREKRSVTSRGGYFPLAGAKRGPMPAHDIPIWVSAISPEMLRLAGQRADVWFAPFEDMRPVDVQVACQYIDDAATEAGRDPREIRRVVTISNATSLDDLLPLVVEHGVGSFLLQSDNSQTIEQFARETMPALRKAAERELSGPLSAVPVRRADVRAKRMPRIDYDSIPESLKDSVIEPGDVTYPSVRSTYIRGGSPGIVLQPRTTSEVVDTLTYARAYPDLPLSIRSRRMISASGSAPMVHGCSD